MSAQVVGVSADRASTSAATGSNRWVNGVLLWADAVAVVSLVMMLVPWFTKDFFNWVVFGSTAEPTFISPDAREYLRLVFSIAAALTIAVTISVAWLAHIPLRRGESWAWTAIATSVGTWFVLDSTASVLLGFERNAVLNVVFIAPLVPLMLALRPGRRAT